MILFSTNVEGDNVSTIRRNFMKLRGRSIFCTAVIAFAFLVLPAAAYALQFTDITDVAGVGDRGHCFSSFQ